ncbi:P protein isoform X2 [Toxorhynchites rutilus septentrionalis]|uniref:P protein isoform X2 n=1 Tax=Toxorhynchites rutilus septentrionalis TaxID=329112 RepID=UPI002478B11A|nr:P protein isoform X2 [Toxorhynchites rutilus septentrionalis]
MWKKTIRKCFPKNRCKIGSTHCSGSLEMKVKATGKRILRRRKSSKKSLDKFPTPNQVTEASLEIWRALPAAIRQDPSLASFRQEHERLHGPDDDPLPNEDVSADDGDDNSKEFITIKVTNPENGVDGADGKLTSIETTPRGGKQQHNGEKHGPNVTVDGDGDDTEVTMHAMHGHPHSHHGKVFSFVKISALLVVWLIFTGFLMSKNEKELEPRQMSIPEGRVRTYILPYTPPGPRVGIYLKGAFLNDQQHNMTSNYVSVNLQLLYTNSNSSNLSYVQEHEVKHVENVTDVWMLPVPINPEMIDQADEITRKHVFDIGPVSHRKVTSGKAVIRVHMTSNVEADIPVKFTYDSTPMDKETGVIYAAVVLLGLYVLIIWEVVHRTFAAIVASTLAIGVLAAMDERPSMPKLISWIDVETLLLLFGMMILVAILSETGIFDFLAVYAYQVTNGQVWPLVNCLCIFTAVLSSFLDNVTTVLLMTPVTIRLCEVMELNPVPVLMSMVIYSNVGGTLTPVGDPPNVIIASNSYISKNGVNFATFTLHMAIPIAIVMVTTYFQLRMKFKTASDLRFNEPQDVQEIRHEIAVWQRAAASLSSYSKDEDLVRETLLKKVNRLSRALKKKLVTGSVPAESYKATLEELRNKYPIRNTTLLIKSAVTLAFVITFFFLHSAPDIQKLSLGWTALLGAVLLLILADREDIESVIARVEWSTLLFFAALFILMEALAELGLIEWIGRQTENVILSVSEESRLAVALLLILWVSAFASAFVDNIPLTTMMVKIAIGLAENEALGLPLQPLVWALALGACLGGNGTLIGASANVVCAGVAEQHGYRFTFIEYFKVGFPVMVGSVIVSTIYLMFAHVVFTWH